MKHIMFKSGFFRRANKNEESGGELSFTKILKRVLGYFGVPVYDPCCTAPDTVPVGVRTQTIVEWNPTRQTYDNVCVLKLSEIKECGENEGTIFQNKLHAEGGVFGDNGGMIAGLIQGGNAEILTGPSTITVDSYLTNIKTTGVADAFVMGDGYTPGQLKKIVHYIDGGSAVITPSNLANGTTITMTTVGEFVQLFWNGTDWFVFEVGNTATPGTLPVIA